jgi:hypothetical protein
MLLRLGEDEDDFDEDDPDSEDDEEEIDDDEGEEVEPIRDPDPADDRAA